MLNKCVLVLLASAFALGQGQPAAAPAQGAEPKAGEAKQEEQAKPAAPAKAEYVGSEACGMCHEEVATAFKKTRHQALEGEKKRGWEGKSCEACHGPGSLHAESTDVALIVNPAKLPAAKENNNCLDCHRNQRARVGPVFSGHAKDQVSCSQCHFVHPKEGKRLFETRRAETNAMCSSCHQTQKAMFERPHTHPVSQSAMACTDCHNPHNSVGVAHKRLAVGSEPSCIGCHNQMRGPFVFEHAPMRSDGCTACHQPHGSQNPKMLTRANVSTLCLECHSSLRAFGGAVAARSQGAIGAVPPAIHDLSNPRYQTCTTCHRKIHGSHVDRSLQR